MELFFLIQRKREIQLQIFDGSISREVKFEEFQVLLSLVRILRQYSGTGLTAILICNDSFYDRNSTNSLLIAESVYKLWLSVHRLIGNLRDPM